jgi:hypothetical protein
MPFKRIHSGHAERFHYTPCGSWSSKQTVAEQANVARILETPAAADGQPADAPLGWMRLVASLPPAFRSALHAELVAGNAIVGIASSDWPAPESVLVYMQYRFTVARRSPPSGVVWRNLNDPHYWKQDLEQRVGDRIFLAIW